MCHGFLIFHLVTCVTMWHMLPVSHHFWSPNLESHRCDMCDSVTMSHVTVGHMILVTWLWQQSQSHDVTVTPLLTQPWHHTSWLPHVYLMFTSRSPHVHLLLIWLTAWLSQWVRLTQAMTQILTQTMTHSMSQIVKQAVHLPVYK